MPGLQNDLQLILQTEYQPNKIRCEGFRRLPITHPVFIGLATDRTPQAIRYALELRSEIILALQQMSVALESPPPPCPGAAALPCVGGCHAFEVPDCRKVLVLVGDGTASLSVDSWLDSEMRTHGTYHVLPVLPDGTDPRSVLSPPLQRVNCAFWKQSIREIVPSLLSTAGLVSNDYKIFITYKRDETSPLAEQVFDALTHENFDVFLDRFRVPPGVDFQRRLSQELSDKSMVLVLESPSILASQWTVYEILFAWLHRLGIAAIHVPGGQPVPGLTSSRRFSIGSSQLSRSGTLLDPDLQLVVDFIKRQHGVALSRKKALLRQNLSDALLYAGIFRHTVSSNGLLQIEAIAPANPKKYSVWLTPRPPELQDFHLTDSYTGSGERGVVIGPARFFESHRKNQVDWLSQTSDIACIDEGHLLLAARDMARGTL